MLLRLLRALVRSQQWLSRQFDRLLPVEYRRDGNTDFVERFVWPYLKPGATLYDVGGGSTPLLTVAQKQRLGVKVVALDIDAGELAAAPDGGYDEKICADLTRYRGRGDGDVAICQAVLEHVRDTGSAIEALASMLKPGGVALIFVPSRNAVFARLNLLLPAKWKLKLLHLFLAAHPKKQGFPAWYDRCTPAGILRLAESHGLRVAARREYFTSSYLSCCFPLFVLWRLWVLAFRLLAGAQAAETFSMALEKPREAAAPQAPEVLRVLTRLGAGGPPIHAVTLTREMSRFGYHTVLATGKCGNEDGDMSYLLRKDDPVCWIPEMSRSVSIWNDLCALWRLFRLMRRTRPAIVHTHTAKAGMLGRLAARLAGVPIVVHTFHGNVLSGYFSPPVNWAIRQVERFLALLSDALCVLSPEQRVEMTERYRIAAPAKVKVVPLGMDLGQFEQLELPSAAGVLTVGWLGRFVGIKNLPLLVSVIEETLRRSDRIRFVIAGDGPESAGVEAAAARFGDRVRWLGWQRDIVPVIRQCHVLLQTSHNEGTPVALIQGMAAGRAFLSTPVGGVVDMVAGEAVQVQSGARWFANAVLADPDPTAFARALCRLLEQPGLVDSMGRAARKFATERYTLPALLENLNRLYLGLLNDKLHGSAATPASTIAAHTYAAATGATTSATNPATTGATTGATTSATTPATTGASTTAAPTAATAIATTEP